MAPNILLINIHSFCNAGDAALALAAIDELHQHFPNCKIKLVLNDPASYSGQLPVLSSFEHRLKITHPDRTQSWHLWPAPWILFSSLVAAGITRWLGKPGCILFRKSALLLAYSEADLVISCAGGYLYSSGRLSLTLLIKLFAMALAILFGKPLYLLPQSIGPLKRWWERKLIRWVLFRARVIMVREPISMGELCAVNLEHTRCHQVPDMGFTFRPQPDEKGVDWLHAHGIRLHPARPLLGITAMNWGGQNSGFDGQSVYEQALATTARFFIDRYSGGVILFSQVCGPTPDQDDRLVVRRIAALLGDLGESVLLLDQPLEPSLLKTLYGFVDLLIGTRMHSNIFALAQEVPVLAIGYHFKSMGIVQWLGLQQWVIDINQIDGNNLTELLTTLWNQRQDYREGIRQRLTSIIQGGHHPGALIAADYRMINKPGKK